MRRRLTRTISIVATIFLFDRVLERNAAAQCKEAAPRVEVAITGASSALERSLRAELASELDRGDLCATGPSGASRALARIEITVVGDATATVRIVDAVTKKTVERPVDVSALPPDGRALPIAISADELLRASWAEINLASSETPRTEEVPKVVRESVKPPPPPPAFARRNEIGLRFAPAFYGGGQSELGAALYYARDFVPWLGGELWGYGREGVAAHAPDGSIRAHAGGGGLSLTAHALRTGPLRLGPRLGAEIGYVLFEGEGTSGATASRFGGVTCFGMLGLASSVEVSPVRLSLALSALAPFRTAKALDGAAVATAASGAGFSGGLGAGVAF